MSEIVVKISGLTKKYDTKSAVDHISLDISKGEIFGLLGPNGAGKSTTMNMVCALTKPTAGKIEIFGKDIAKEMNYIKNNIGYVPQEIAVHPNLKAWENVELFTSLYGFRGKELKVAVTEALNFVGLNDMRDDYVRKFSGGMKRRLNIACAIGHRPNLLFFDEPTVGIDPQSRNFILEKIKFINKQGVTVIYTSHYMEEIEAVCRRIAIMDNGKIIAIGTKAELVSLVTNDPESNMSLEDVFLTLTGKKLRDYGEAG